MKMANAIVCAVLFAAGRFGSGDALAASSAESPSTVVDTRAGRLTAISIVGPSSVIGGCSATFIARATYTDALQEDVSAHCVWLLVGTVPVGF